MAEREAAEDTLEEAPDPSDTASWLVEGLGPPAPEPAAQAAEDEEDWGGAAPAAEAQPETEGSRDEDPAPDAQAEPDGSSPKASSPEELDHLGHELAAATTELEGRIRHEVVAEVDQRREEIALQGSAALAQAKAAIAETEQRLLRESEAKLRGERERTAGALGEATVQLRAELTEVERRLGGQIVEEIRAHAQAFERKRESLADGIQAITARLDTLEERVRGIAAESGETRDTLAVLARYRAPARAEGDNEVQGVDLNDASFEDLRRLGLSSTQAARVITHRDAMGGFDSVDRLKQVPGLPPKLFERIRPRVSV
ncbi:MAG: helix-hairpin-helix domain-containing protein [Solirubrobacterales bacterium]